MRYCIVILFSVILFSCGERKEEFPADVLPKDQFISVLIDMYTLESEFSHANLIDKPTYKSGVKKYEDLFRKHKTTKDIVEKSIDYYASDPTLMKEIQIIVLDSINSRSNK